MPTVDPVRELRYRDVVLPRVARSLERIPAGTRGRSPARDRDRPPTVENVIVNLDAIAEGGCSSRRSGPTTTTTGTG